jgi:hypothetical protein
MHHFPHGDAVHTLADDRVGLLNANVLVGLIARPGGVR